MHCKDETTISWCMNMFNKYILNQVKIPFPILHIIFIAVVANGNDSYYNQIFNIYSKTENGKLKRPAFKALWYSKNPKHMIQNIGLLYEENFRKNYIYKLHYAFIENEVARKHVWDHIIEYCGKIIKRDCNLFL